MLDAIESQFHEAMLEIYRRAKDEAKYNASLFLRTVEEQGGFQAARTLISVFRNNIGTGSRAQIHVKGSGIGVMVKKIVGSADTHEAVNV